RPAHRVVAHHRCRTAERTHPPTGDPARAPRRRRRDLHPRRCAAHRRGNRGHRGDRPPRTVGAGGPGWLGVTYLLWFAWTSLRSARTASGLEADTHQRSLKSIVLTTLALTFLNPGVYLDTVVMLGNLAHQQGHGGVGPFTIGAMLGSATWFLG